MLPMNKGSTRLGVDIVVEDTGTALTGRGGDAVDAAGGKAG